MTIFIRSSICALLAALCSACIVVFLVAGVHRDQLRIKEKRSHFITSRDNAYHKIEEQDYLTVNRRDFKHVMAKVQAGTKQRRSWVELLSAAKHTLNLSEIQFDIYPLLPINTKPAISQIDVGQETIELSVGLLHEGELVELLSFLSKNASTAFEITFLEVQRVNSTEGTDLTSQTEINLRLNCTIRWYSLAIVGDDIERT